MSSNPVALILGFGPRVGAAVAAQFASTGYSVAITSRKASSGKTPENYNAAALTLPPSADDLFSIPIEAVTADLNTNTVSVYAAAKEAIKGWETLTGDAKKVFIYTGNKCNTWIAPMIITATLGIGKSASSYLMGLADGTFSKEKGYR
jgi:NAD(P)-dependent dehydrogenase (short-subunit alcohol dehydrogenase family)